LGLLGEPVNDALKIRPFLFGKIERHCVTLIECFLASEILHLAKTTRRVLVTGELEKEYPNVKRNEICIKFTS